MDIDRAIVIISELEMNCDAHFGCDGCVFRIDDKCLFAKRYGEPFSNMRHELERKANSVTIKELAQYIVLDSKLNEILNGTQHEMGYDSLVKAIDENGMLRWEE